MENSQDLAQESDTKERLRERQSEATSTETLSDLESGHKLEERPERSDRDVPAPDAQPEEPRKDHDDAGPM